MTAPQTPPPPPTPHQPAVSSVAQPPPEPPRGPGVVVPFAVPPRDQDRKRTLITSLIAGAVALVAVLALVGGTMMVLVWSSQEMSSRASHSAEVFLNQVVAGDYEKAYSSMCRSKRAELSAEEFTAEWQSIGVKSFRLGTVTTSDGGDTVVPTELRQNDGSRKIGLTVELTPKSMTMAVCDW